MGGILAPSQIPSKADSQSRRPRQGEFSLCEFDGHSLGPKSPPDGEVKKGTKHAGRGAQRGIPGQNTAEKQSQKIFRALTIGGSPSWATTSTREGSHRAEKQKHSATSGGRSMGVT